MLNFSVTSYVYVSVHIATTDGMDNTRRLAVALSLLVPVTVLACGIVIAVAVYKTIQDMKNGKLT